MSLFLIQLLTFSSIVLFILGLNMLRHATNAAKTQDSRPGLFGWFPDEISAVGRALEPTISAVFPQETLQIRNNLVAAALDDRLKVQDIRGLQGFLGLIMFFLFAVLILVVTLEAPWAVLGGIIFGLMGYCYPLIWLRRVTSQRQKQIAGDLPFAIDLLTVAMEAGQDFGAAIRHLVNEMTPSPLRQEFRMMLRETELNKSRLEAMRSMSARIQVEEFKALVTAVAQSTEMGASVAASLKLQAEEIRRTRFHRAERKAARAPSLMLIPLALFILPAVFIVILTPIILRLLNTMHSMK